MTMEIIVSKIIAIFRQINLIKFERSSWQSIALPVNSRDLHILWKASYNLILTLYILEWFGKM